jgi:3-oxoacyl-[acyl-carrier protein] reductase
MKIDFAGKTAFVTGGGHGIGQRIALDLAAAGARVFASDLDPAELEQTVRAAEPGRIEARPMDVTDPDAVRNTLAGLNIDVLVHSAGGVCGQEGRPIEEITPQDWQAILAVNLTGAFLVAQAAIPRMKQAGGGRILFISSGAGLGVSLTGIQAYASAKAGEIGLTRQLAHELGQYGITVNSVAPGFLRSNPASERQWQSYGEEGQQRMIERIAMRRLGRVEDIADAALFLVSDRAGWITGQTLSVDGGK